jgi:glycosyltransferase involved in cell wall biosynthesis
VSSSDAEGFSNVIAEGMACGTPVVGTDVGDSRVLIGDFGTVVAARDVRAITSAMVAARRESVAGRAARHAYIAGAYGVDRLLDRSEQVLLQLVQQAA